MTIDSLLRGGYLLSHFRSTIGVVRLNFSVRNGKRWDPHAMTTLLPFQHDRPILHAPRLWCLKKETIGGNATRENRRSVNLRALRTRSARRATL